MQKVNRNKVQKIGACLAHVATASRNVDKCESLIEMEAYLNQLFSQFYQIFSETKQLQFVIFSIVLYP